MEQKVKEIVATFIKVPADQIGAATPIDRSAVQSSILLHRMYARLAEEGFAVENYTAIKMFGDLFQGIAGRQNSEVREPGPAVPIVAGRVAGSLPAEVGIDIEEIAALPRTTDFRKEEFYKMNFTAAEMAYCILQPDPYASFAGLFAVKEAIIKAGGSSGSGAFNVLQIDHSPEGRPLHPDYGISISHAGGMAIAVAARAAERAAPQASLTAPTLQAEQAGKKYSAVSWIAWMALLLSVTALLIVILH